METGQYRRAQAGTAGERKLTTELPKNDEAAN